MEQNECIKTPRRSGTQPRDWSKGVKCADCELVMYDRSQSGDGKCALCKPCKNARGRLFSETHRKPCPGCKLLIDKYVDMCGKCRKAKIWEGKEKCPCGKGKMPSRSVCARCMDKARLAARRERKRLEIQAARGILLAPEPPPAAKKAPPPPPPPRIARVFPTLAADIKVDESHGSFRAYDHGYGGWTYRPMTMRQAKGGVPR